MRTHTVVYPLPLGISPFSNLAHDVKPDQYQQDQSDTDLCLLGDLKQHLHLITQKIGQEHPDRDADQSSQTIHPYEYGKGNTQNTGSDIDRCSQAGSKTRSETDDAGVVLNFLFCHLYAFGCEYLPEDRPIKNLSAEISPD
mgnify:CR=1 FL=1